MNFTDWPWRQGQTVNPPLEGKTMNKAQIERVREIVQELSEKSGADFNAAFETAISMMKYHAIDGVPWGKSAASGSGGVEKR